MPLEASFIKVTSVEELEVVEEEEPVVTVVVELTVQVQVLSFLQDAKLKANAATAKIVIFFIVEYFLNFYQK